VSVSKALHFSAILGGAAAWLPTLRSMRFVFGQDTVRTMPSWNVGVVQQIVIVLVGAGSSRPWRNGDGDTSAE